MEENVWFSLQSTMDHEVLIITIVSNLILFLDILERNDVRNGAMAVPDPVLIAGPQALLVR
jgi:hypothetical protein